MKPIIDSAEVSVEFPDKAYVGQFGHASRYEAHCDPESMVVKLRRSGEERREVVLHLHHYLFAGILQDLAESIEAGAVIDAVHATETETAARRLAAALSARRGA
jgi:hypothetical protein